MTAAFWVLFVAACLVCLVAVPVCIRLEEREYHPDPEINAEIVADALAGEIADLAAGYAPKFWRCPDCGIGHKRGHFQAIGVHRCLRCGYVGEGGTMHTHDAEGRLV